MWTYKKVIKENKNEKMFHFWDRLRLLRLNSDSAKKIERIDKLKWKMWMKVHDVYDGDTINVLCLHNGHFVKWRCRMKGYDSPEMKSKNEEEKKAAIAARDFLKTLLPKSIFLAKCEGLDKYGRILLDLHYKGLPIKEIMILNQHGLEYDGGTKKAWIPIHQAVR